MYFGQQGTNMSSASVVEGPGNASRSQYFRLTNQHHPEYMVVANKILNLVSNTAIRVRKVTDPLINMVHQPLDATNGEYYSQMKSTTFGKRNGVMAFACSMHTDRSDLFDDKERSEFLSKLLMNASMDAAMYQKYIRYFYFWTFCKVHGIGKPTTVMYHEIPGLQK